MSESASAMSLLGDTAHLISVRELEFNHSFAVDMEHLDLTSRINKKEPLRTIPSAKITIFPCCSYNWSIVDDFLDRQLLKGWRFAGSTDTIAIAYSDYSVVYR